MHKRIHGRQSIPAIILCSPERAMKHPNHYAGIFSNCMPVFPAPALPIHTIRRATAAHSTPASPRNKATLFSKMRAEKERRSACKRPPGKPDRTYFPASRLAVINPTLSMPEPRMMSMALATSAKRTASSPLTKATFSARSLNTSDRRGPSESQVASSSLIFSFPVSRI